MREQGLPVQELFGGCICCTLQAGLVETLRAVESRYAPDWVIVEPTGLAAPGDILGVVVDHCPDVDAIRVLTLVDAARWPMLLEIVEPLVTAQLEAADVVAVNKVDDVDEEALAGVMESVRALAGKATVLPVSADHRRRHEAPAGGRGLMREHGARGHDGHDHLSAPARGCARRRCSRRGPTSSSTRLRTPISSSWPSRDFFAALSGGLADAGCTLVGHIKGTLTAPGHGDLAFHATALAAEPALTGGVAGAGRDAVLTVNVIVFGVDEQALSAIVTSAWSRATGAETVWRR